MSEKIREKKAVENNEEKRSTRIARPPCAFILLRVNTITFVCGGSQVKSQQNLIQRNGRALQFRSNIRQLSTPFFLFRQLAYRNLEDPHGHNHPPLSPSPSYNGGMARNLYLYFPILLRAGRGTSCPVHPPMMQFPLPGRSAMAACAGEA